MADNEISLAYLAGKLKALSYEPGDAFLGSMGESEKHGYRTNPLLHAVFSVGYSEHLPRPIVTDRDNIIISVG